MLGLLGQRVSALSLRTLAMTALSVCVLLAGPVVKAAAQAGGVAVDADGVLRVRKTGGNARLKSIRDNRKAGQPGKVYISLPKLFAEVKRLAAANEKLPDNLRFLEGMVKLENVFVYPEEKDLVIFGASEPFEVSDPYRPMGNVTGRPVLQLDDLIVALRAVGPGGAERVYGCSIDLPEGGIERMQSVSRQLGAVRQGNFASPGRRMATAVGPQKIRIFGVPASSRFGHVCLEADYLMKRMALGLEASPVKGVKSYLALMQPGESVYNRQWFTPMYEPLLVSSDGQGYEIRGQALKVAVSASDQSDDEGSASPGARKFAEGMTTHFVELSKHIPSYADLWNLVDLSVLAALIRADKLNDRVGWNLDWIADEGKYQVAKYTVPRTAETLVNYRKTGNVVNFSVGGVQVSPGSLVKANSRATDDSGRIVKLGKRRVTAGWSKRVEAEAGD